jgi:hypothetical protein
MTRIPMRRDVQGYGHSTTPFLLPMNTREGSAQAMSLGVAVCARAGAVWDSAHAPQPTQPIVWRFAYGTIHSSNHV